MRLGGTQSSDDGGGCTPAAQQPAGVQRYGASQAANAGEQLRCLPVCLNAYECNWHVELLV